MSSPTAAPAARLRRPAELLPAQRTTPLPLPAALCASIAGGVMLSWAFPDRGWWPVAFVAAALVLIGVRGARSGRAAGLGFCAGFAFYLTHVNWAAFFLGPVPMLALVTVMAAWWALGHLGISAAYRLLPRRSDPRARLGALPLAVAGIWTLREALSSTWPYGGFGWGRIAQSQSDSPFTPLVSWLGLSGMGFVLVWLVALAVEILLLPHPVRPPLPGSPDHGSPGRPRALRSAFGRWLPRALTVAALFGALSLWPLYPVSTTGHLRVLAVQGDTPGASYFIPSEPGSTLRAHLDATRTVPPAADVDVILWPEGSVDVSPTINPSVARALDGLTAEYGAPLLANGVTWEGDPQDPAARFWNTQYLWRSGDGITAQYDKAHPVPFGEYVPDRDFFMALAPDLVGLIQREYTPGTRSTALPISDSVTAGVLICYDIVDDGLVRQAIDGGSQVLFAPTNNADFGYGAEQAQQLAFARMRAVESGRSMVQASTVGYSAVYAPDGSVLDALPWYTPGAMLVDVPLAEGVTPAIAFGRGIEVFAAGLGVVLLVTARWDAHQARRRIAGPHGRVR